MRWAWCVLLMVACDDFSSVQQLDTIEAYEQYLEANPGSRHAFQAETRVEELYLKRARDERTVAAYDIYLDKFPEGSHLEAVNKEREQVAFDAAWFDGTGEGWQAFLDAHPGATRDHYSTAKKGAKLSLYIDNITFSQVRIEDVNLAEDPTGPLNGKGFYVDATNTGTEAVASLWLGIAYLDDQRRPLVRKRWPVVAPSFPTPIEEEKKIPMASGETRTWEWTTGDLPDDWSGKVAVVPLKLTLADNP